jgi:U3 small nucleolar RNA-associated protein 11
LAERIAGRLDAGDDDDDEDNGVRRKPKKIVFANDVGERDLAMADATGGLAEDEPDDDEDDQKGQFEGFADDEDGGDQEVDEEQRAKLLAVGKLKRKLDVARMRHKAVAAAEEALEEQRAKTAKTATSGGHTKSGKRIVVHKRKR